LVSVCVVLRPPVSLIIAVGYRTTVFGWSCAVVLERAVERLGRLHEEHLAIVDQVVRLSRMSGVNITDSDAAMAAERHRNWLGSSLTE